MNGSRALGLWLPVVAFMVAVLAFAEQGPESITLPIWDKGVHAAAYTLLGLLSLRATHGRIAKLRWGPVLLALAITVAFGAIDEWNQTRFPYRDPSLGDLSADAVGGLAAVGVVGFWTRRREVWRGAVGPGD